MAPTTSFYLRLALMAVLPSAALASGHYTQRAPQPGAVAQVDDYELGKSLFLGRTPVGAVQGQNRTRQAARLGELQEKLPPSVRKNADLPSLAGRLDPRQVAALEHYLAVRYKVK
jgi:hypothetical protein